MNYSTKRNVFIVLFSIILFLFITCTEEPAGPDISEDLKPKGTITGWVYDMWNRPIKDVLVSVNADSADAGVSTATGQFTVGNVREGTYVLRFTHRDYEDNPTCTVDVSLGMNDTVWDTVSLSYRYYILQGRVVYQQLPVGGAGVALAGTPFSTITNAQGVYVLDKVPKWSAIKLICAKDTLGFNIVTVADSLVDDGTTQVADISLDRKGANVSGIVYDPDRLPMPWTVVKAVGGGITCRSDKEGKYYLRNVPIGEQDIRFFVITADSSLVGAVTGIMLDSGAVSTGIDIYLRNRSDLVNGMYLNVQDVIVNDTASTTLLSAWPTTNCTTVVALYAWSLDSLDTITATPYFAYTMKPNQQSFSGRVSAVNTRGEYSAQHTFSVIVKNSKPVILRAGVAVGIYEPVCDSLTINKGNPVYFVADIIDPVGGIDSTWWHFGNGDYRATDGVFEDALPYTYPDAGTFRAIVRSKDTDSQDVFDTAVVHINTPPLFPQTLIINNSAAVNMPYRFVLDAEDADSDAVAFRLLSPIPGMTLNTDTVLWTPTIIDTGIYAVSAEAFDNRGGADTLTWSIRVTLLPATNAFLENITISAGDLSPVFDSATYSCFVAVPANVAYFRIKPIPQDAAASLAVNGAPLTVGKYTDFISLTAGTPDTFSIVVTAQDAVSQRNYQVIVTRDMGSNAKLANLTLSNGILMPIFNPDITLYEDSVGYDVQYVTVRPTSIDPSATITVNDSIVPSGGESNWIQLMDDPDTITVAVTAEDDSITMVYSVIINHRPSNNSSLANLVLSVPGMQPGFHPNTMDYSATVSKATASVTITPTLFDTGTVTVNGLPVASGTASSPIVLKGGPNVIPVIVTAMDGISTRTYTVTVTRQMGSSSNLISLTSVSGFTPAFSNQTTAYYDTVEHEIASYSLTAQAEEPGAVIMINNDTVVSGTAHSVAIQSGTTPIPVTVVAEDQSSKKDFLIQVTRMADVSLAGLGISAGTLSPQFHAESLSYTCTVENDTSFITVVPTASSPGIVSMTVNGSAINSGTVSQQISLAVGQNPVTVQVNGVDGFSSRSYTVTVTRKASGNANLSGLTISEGIMIPSFHKDILNYNDTVDVDISSVTITPTAEHPAATIMVNGSTHPSGTPTTPLPVDYGDNTMTIAVIAGDGNTQKTYTIHVVRKPNSIVTLTSLDISNGSLCPVFDTSGTDTNYSMYVPYEIVSVTVTPTGKEPRATIRVNGTIVASGSPTQPLSLIVGNNTVTILVTAMDGITTKTYTIIVTREPQGSTFTNGLLVKADTTITLQKAQSPYHFGAGILVQPLGTLIIEPGVTLLMDSAVSIDVQGLLVARGNATDSIVFRAYNSSKHWGYLLFSDSAENASFDLDTNYVSGCIMGAPSKANIIKLDNPTLVTVNHRQGTELSV